jgi:hypothetical protein
MADLEPALVSPDVGLQHVHTALNRSCSRFCGVAGAMGDDQWPVVGQRRMRM